MPGEHCGSNFAHIDRAAVTLNIATTPYVALLVEVKGASLSSGLADTAAMYAELALATHKSAPKPTVR